MKFRTIEIFGLPGVGKSTFEKELRSSLISKNTNVINRREVIVHYSYKFLDFNILDYITLNLYKFFEKVKNRKLQNYQKINLLKKRSFIYKKKFNFLNFFRRRYMIICRLLFYKLYKNKIQILKLVNFLIKNFEKKDKDLFAFWIYEMFVASYIFKKKKLNSKIYLTDEGFIHRCFMILYSNIRNKNDFLKKFYKICPKPDYCIYLKGDLKRIYKVHEIRKIQSTGISLNKKDILKFKNFEKKIYNLFKKKIPNVKIFYDKNSIKKIEKFIS